jgi:hypothetical protein
MSEYANRLVQIHINCIMLITLRPNASNPETIQNVTLNLITVQEY